MSVTNENSTLKQKIKKKTVKIVKPDGTTVESEVYESDTEATKEVISRVKKEFNQKITEVESKYKKIYKERLKEIKKVQDQRILTLQEELKRQKNRESLKRVTKVNQKQLGIEYGILNNFDSYGHITYDIWGPVFIGAHGQMGIGGTNQFGVGIGIRI